MNATEAKGNLTEQKGRLKQKFAGLVNNDQLFAEGKKEEMFGKHQAGLGQTKEKLKKITASL
ncbi:MAG: CsbD family protein [Prolixibacteraceae bacterium]|nr:CsbD family protein [Prolixibacteraceae bacterium]